jgi:rubrerythrin
MSDEMIKTLEEIIEVEKHMKAKFNKLAKDAPTPEMRALFTELSHEEEGHEKELTERLTALKLMSDR